jgi:hypothetical protein
LFVDFSPSRYFIEIGSSGSETAEKPDNVEMEGWRLEKMDLKNKGSGNLVGTL